jgi:hypothetical protein
LKGRWECEERGWREGEETANWMESGILMTATFCCFRFIKKWSVRGVADMFTSITTGHLKDVEFPSFHRPSTRTFPVLSAK